GDLQRPRRRRLGRAIGRPRPRLCRHAEPELKPFRGARHKRVHVGVLVMPIRLMENFRAVFYAPYYATYALGFYQREGVEVELLTSDAPGDAVPKLMDSSVDLTWGGPMRVMK